MSSPPMYGDYEAQRHWMEITISLNINEWYKNTINNDLLYWGLDYPPLTAYTSYTIGKIVESLYPDLVLLHTSRGHESVYGKVIMRLSVIIMDILIFIPSIILYAKIKIPSSSSSSSSSTSTTLLSSLSSSLSLSLICLCCPSIILIDHGHFQYNCIAIGLTLLSSSLILLDNDIIGSILFCLSLNFKQMTLYYSPVFFFCLLRKCYEKKTMMLILIHFMKLGITVIVTFGILWAPFCIYASSDTSSSNDSSSSSDTCISSLLHVLQRQFPFSRGIFEDKVANIWYCASIIIDFRQYLSIGVMAKLSLVLTLLLLLPICLNLLMMPLCPTRMLLALMNSGLAFFLASFQVHEKSLLLVLVPASLLLNDDIVLVTWIQILGTFSMFPLLIRDGHRITYIIMIIIFTVISLLYKPVTQKSLSLSSSFKSWKSIKLIMIVLSSIGMIVLHIMEAFVTPPKR